MSRTVTALYDSRAEAEAARQRLSSEVNLSSARIIDQESHGSGRSEGSLNHVPLSHEDRHAYGEGLRRGGFLLCAEVTSHEDSEKIVRLLEESSSVDLDQRQEDWRRDGWSPPAAGSGNVSSAANIGGTAHAGTTGSESGRTIAEEHIPLVEEELVVGKREVRSGGARVRTYVREVPVHEQVTLREEHVSVERRPVNETLARGALDRDSDLLRDRTIEMTETAEEAVVGKEARVREEVVIRKTAEEHVEQIDDTVRRTEVDVDENARGSNERSAFGGFDSDRGTSR
jgi:uncharacterized protein (TIGR02271 family)